MKFFKKGTPILELVDPADFARMGPPLKRVGYWYDPDDRYAQDYPKPEDCVDKNWDPRERRRVIRYLKAADYGPGYPGSSWCRFGCGISRKKMGYRDKSDGVYIFPEGYIHYLEKHHVRPPEEFLEHVRNRLSQTRSARFRAALAALFRK